MKSVVAAVSCSLILGACATTSSAPEKEVVMVDPHKMSQTVASNDSVVVCRNEHVLGSHFKKQRCMTKEALEDERAATRQMLRHYPKAGPGPINK